jgi:hypothetical protein
LCLTDFLIRLHLLLCFRYAHTGDVVARYLAYVRQRFAAVFLCVLHLWHCRRSTVGRNSASEVLFKAIAQHQLSTVSTASHSVHPDLFTALFLPVLQIAQLHRRKLSQTHEILSRPTDILQEPSRFLHDAGEGDFVSNSIGLLHAASKILT